MTFVNKIFSAGKIVFGVAVGSLVAITVISAVVVYSGSKTSARTDTLERLDIIAADRDFRVNQFVDDQLQELIRIARIPTIRDISAELLSADAGTPAFRAAYDTLDRLLQSVALNAPDLSEVLLLTDPEGDVFFSTIKESERQSRIDSDYFRQGLSDSVIQNVYPSDDTGVPTITVATPLIDSQGRRLGVGAAHLDLGRLDGIVGDLTGLGNTGELYMVDSSGRLISAQRFGTEEFPGTISSEGIDSALIGRPGSGQYTNYAGESVIGIYRWLPDRETALLVEMETSEVFASARRLGFIVLGAGFGVTALIALGWYLIARQIREAAIIKDVVMTFSGYDLGGFYDETIDRTGQPHHGSALLTEFIEDLPAGQLLRHQKAAEQAFTRLGINFNVYGDESGVDRIWPFDIVPRIIEQRWSRLSEQRCPV